MISGAVLRKLAFGAAIAAFAAAAPASAADYVFAVNYTGGVATLADPSDDPLTTSLLPGDTFSYLLTATDGDWKKISSTAIFPFFALPVSEAGVRVGDYVLVLSDNGTAVFLDAQNDVGNSSVHVGTNDVLVPLGLVWDSYLLTYKILSDTAGIATPNSLFPWPGSAPEIANPDDIAFGTFGAVPEPASWMMMISGMGLAGAMLRRRRRVSASLG